MSKPRISKGRITGQYVCYDPPLNSSTNKAAGWGSTPKEAYEDYVRAKIVSSIKEIPPHVMGFQPPEIVKESAYEQKPKRWWEIWK